MFADTFVDKQILTICFYTVYLSLTLLLLCISLYWIGQYRLNWREHLFQIDDSRIPKPVSYTHLDVYKRQI